MNHNTDTDELHAIFLLKKNTQQDIVKTILEYAPIAMPETLKEWKVAIMSVGQEYESMEECHNYKTSTGTIYGGRRQPMDIGKSNNNFKDEKPKYFNYNIKDKTPLPLIGKVINKLKKAKYFNKCSIRLQ